MHALMPRLARASKPVPVTPKSGATSFTGMNKSGDELVNISCGVGWRVKAPVELTLQRWLDTTNLFVRNGAPFEPAFSEQIIHATCVIMVAPCPVDVKNSAPLIVEVNVLVLRHGKEFVASGNSEPRGGNGVGFIVATAFNI